MIYSLKHLCVLCNLKREDTIVQFANEVHDLIRRDAKGRSKKQKEKTEARILEKIRSENGSRQAIKLEDEHCQYNDFVTGSPDVEIFSLG